MVRLGSLWPMAGWLMLAVGCGRGDFPSPTEQPASVQDVSDRVSQSEQRSSQQLRQLTKKCDELQQSLSAAQQSQTTFEAATAKDLAAIKARLEKLADKLDQLPAVNKLQMNIPFEIKGTLEESLAELSKFTTVPMRIEAADLAEANIPKIRYVELPGGSSAEKLLQRAMLEGNLDRATSLSDPRQSLVYVFHAAGGPRKEEVVITTRRRAAQRGMLPAAFGGNP